MLIGNYTSAKPSIYESETKLNYFPYASPPKTRYLCVVTVVLCYLLGGTELSFVSIPKFQVKRDILKQMLPLLCVFTSMIVFNNLCLKYVEISFYHVARSLTIVFNVIFGYIILKQKTSLLAMTCCGIVVSGYFVGNKHELRWTYIGVIYGLLSSFFVAMNSIVVKKKFPLVDNDPWKITLYNNLNASVLFIPIILCSGEPAGILASENARTQMFWILMTVSGALGILMSFAYAAQVKYTSPLTHNVSTTAKSAAQALIALLVYRNPINVMGYFGIAFVFIGSLCYGLVRLWEMKQKKQEPTHKETKQEEKELLSVEAAGSKKAES
eukprot:Plantae.Rhodophyta-Hildenbrandia_rubra.ctg38345.p1 GENE.Plantae.Rhodophyta-Hildenbrandia_rubra.ctg38345~~Plantae.Rhodophyta-Hildenbrandia_rubra.ctg38345.p1  ORF type:complete len:326 (+),score=23.36 Plantae.Rhodophyta-Hildenbrandia_rubra.ctg38345:458-1435(+)